VEGRWGDAEGLDGGEEVMVEAGCPEGEQLEKELRRILAELGVTDWNFETKRK